MQLAVETLHLLLRLCFTFSSTLLFFHSSWLALPLSIRAGAAREQRSNLDLPPQLSLPSPAQTVSAYYPISSRLRLSDRAQVLLLVSMLFYQDATVVY